MREFVRFHFVGITKGITETNYRNSLLTLNEHLGEISFLYFASPLWVSWTCTEHRSLEHRRSIPKTSLIVMFRIMESKAAYFDAAVNGSLLTDIYYTIFCLRNRYFMA